MNFEVSKQDIKTSIKDSIKQIEQAIYNIPRDTYEPEYESSLKRAKACLREALREVEEA